MKSAQLNLRVSQEEKAAYDDRRARGASTEVALMALLHERVQPIPVVAHSGVLTERDVGLQPAPRATEPVVTHVGKDSITVRRALPPGFKPDFKKKGPK